MKNLITILFLAFTASAFAQEQRRSNIYFLKNDGREVKMKDSADFIRVISEPDSGGMYFKVREIYLSGKPKLVGESSTEPEITFEGKVITYYSIGKRQFIRNYANGHLSGDCYEYFPNGVVKNILRYTDIQSYDIITANDSTGKAIVADGNGYYAGYNNNADPKQFVDKEFVIKEEGLVKNGKRDGVWNGVCEINGMTFTETYSNGELNSGISMLRDGVKYQYVKRMEQPMYPDGVPAFYAFFAQNVRYPLTALKNKIQGKVLISLVVGADGVVKNIRIVKSPDELLSNETLRVISLSSKKWLPGKYFGVPVAINYLVPMTYSIGTN